MCAGFAKGTNASLVLTMIFQDTASGSVLPDSQPQKALGNSSIIRHNHNGSPRISAGLPQNRSLQAIFVLATQDIETQLL